MPKYDIVSIVPELVSGENMVRNRQNPVRLRRMRWLFPAFWLPMWRNGGAIAAVSGVVAGFSCLVSL